jgi:hypothetical protein
VTLIKGALPTNGALFTCNGISTYFNSCPNGPFDESYENNGAISAYLPSKPGIWTATLNNLQGGTTSSPLVLPVGFVVAGVTGTIGAYGSQDYYSFSWSGGAFEATASITGANSGASYLFSEGVAGSCSSGSTATLNSDDSFTSTIAVADLAPGQYCIGLNANNANDPAFTLTFNTPVGAAATPEPSGVILLSLGLGMIGVLRLAKATIRPLRP